MPVTMPVPKSYAPPFDTKNPRGYDADPTMQAFSGPYMIYGYSPGKSLTLAPQSEVERRRTPDLRTSTGSTWTMGKDPNVAGRQIFNGT